MPVLVCSTMFLVLLSDSHLFKRMTLL